MRPRAFAALLLAFAPGCARMEPGRGFDDVRREVADRADLKIHWINGTPEDDAAAAAVDALLGRELDADAAVQVALLNNRGLQAVYEELHLAQADVVRAGLLRNPVFHGEARFDTGGGGTGLGLEIAQDFLGLLSMPLRKRLAAAGFEAATRRVTGEVLDAAARTRIAFHEHQAAEEIRAMRATVAAATAASLELAERVYAAGNIRELDVLVERDLHERARVDLAAAEEDVIQTRERLNALMGLWGARTGWRAGARLPPLPDDEPPREGLESLAIERSLDLAIARGEMEVAARSLGLARPFGWLGDAEAGVAAEREVEGGWSVGPSISVPIPLFDQGQAAVGGAAARLRQSSALYYARAVEVRSRVRAAHSLVVSARDRARYYERVILPLRGRIVDHTQLQYNAMQVSAFELLAAKRGQIEAGADSIAALRDYWIARAGLDHVLSGRSTPLERAPVSERRSTGGARPDHD